ncbi:hypothetical protein ACOQFV_24280 [Nocardiopsis changdeensis]|uniref:Endonuclease/exonuclease/phosphatase family protein n=1 Tax=Nocardiopsis changdeensis TaxID=2831969 RepID=A0A975KTG5_9ACTN|nr:MULTISPECIES: hypothetical protein [Nocardiopsis]QUX26488.1 hypothetical protein KGD84_32850 [Nocardiopsis changdeensis]QYX40760.1 hypothetical protein K1J57_32700 [Nocardiopsis sp. MT53]
MTSTVPREVTWVTTNLQSGLDAGRRLDLLPKILEPTHCPDQDPPAVLGMCEGRWWHRAGRAKDEVATILTRFYGVPYEVDVGGIDRSDDPPAIAWRTDLLRRRGWSAPHTDHHTPGHNTAWFSWADDPTDRIALRVQLAHLHYASGDKRAIEAQTLRAQFDRRLTNVLMGDFNCALDGAHGGDRDWMRVPPEKRGEKGRLIQVSTGVWVWGKDSRPFIELLGPWDERAGVRRSELGPGYRALAEVDWEQRGRPAAGLAPTTTTDQALPIDHILGDDTVELVRGGHEVHLNSHSDHGVVVARTRIHPRPA